MRKIINLNTIKISATIVNKAKAQIDKTKYNPYLNPLSIFYNTEDENLYMGLKNNTDMDTQVLIPWDAWVPIYKENILLE